MITSFYIHIPFCKQICNYCDFCKLYYKKEWVEDYLVALKKEILDRYQNETLKTIYIGGGTPSVLTTDELEELLTITTLLHREKDYEFTFECNIESITLEKLQLLKKYGVNRISYGVETFHPKYLKYLNRHHTKEEVFEKIKLTKQYFSNINVDLMYALTGETVEEVKEDLETFLLLEVPHISTYSLIIEPHTVLYNQNITPIDDEIDEKMYKTICHILKTHGYEHYEVSNFAKPNYQSQHNLTYWNNSEYYGCGLGASGYISGVRYTNTRSLSHYLKGNYQYLEEPLTMDQKMEEEMILGLRKIEGVSIQTFQNKYHIDMKQIFPINKLLEEGKLKQENGFVFIPEEQIYLSNEVLIYFIGEV